MSVFKRFKLLSLWLCYYFVVLIVIIIKLINTKLSVIELFIMKIVLHINKYRVYYK